MGHRQRQLLYGRHGHRLLAGALTLLFAAGVVVAQGGPAGAAPRAAERTAGPCHRLARLPTVPASTTEASTQRSTSVKVQVVAVVEVVLTGSGKPAMARTNTGEPPSCDDLFLTLDSPTATTTKPANLAVANETTVSQFSGSWRSGAWVLTDER
jgi:hypothetical protein